MAITRHGSTKGIDALPVISQVVEHSGIVYTCGVTPDPVGDVGTQTKQVLDRIDSLLRRAGSDKSHLLTAQVWLSDMRLFDEHNRAWNDWVDPDNPPVRACLESRLWQPNMLVEIAVTAVKPESALGTE